MILEPRFESFQYLVRVINTRLGYIDLLKTPRQRSIFVKNSSIFLIGGRPHAPHVTRCKQWFQKVRRIHHATRSGTRSNDHVYFINKEDGAFFILQFHQELLEALFKIASIFSTC